MALGSCSPGEGLFADTRAYFVASPSQSPFLLEKRSASLSPRRRPFEWPASGITRPVFPCPPANLDQRGRLAMPPEKEKRCSQCGRRFRPKKKAGRQTTCGRKECHRKRRRRWQRLKRGSDADYRANQAAAQRRWAQKHPNYWREYRRRERSETGPPLPCRDRPPARSSILPPCSFLKWCLPLLVMGQMVIRRAGHGDVEVDDQDA